MIKGQSASSGMAMGVVHRLEKREWKIEIQSKSGADVEKERFNRALEISRLQLVELEEKMTRQLGAEEGAIFTAHRMMLEDPEMLESVATQIDQEGHTAAFALNQVIDTYVGIFEASENSYFQQRSADLKDIRNRLMQNLMEADNHLEEGLGPEKELAQEAMIIVAEDITPSDIAALDPTKVKGFAIEKGGMTSHFVIMANAMGIPTLIQLPGLMTEAQNGDWVVIDSLEACGELYINPTDEQQSLCDERMRAHQRHMEMLALYKGKPSRTLDGHHVELACNIGTALDCDAVIRNDGEGIGLFRTEFLFFDRETLPSEQEQYEVYKTVLSLMAGKRVIIRTMDAGGDKHVASLNLPSEENPFLGYRAIRICLEEKSLFKTQLRAIMRASQHGKAAIMFPMITCLSEIRAAKALLAEVKAELSSEGIAYDAEVEVGIMVEIPAVAVASDRFAAEVDFFSIGTNDLTQYTLAVDRGNEKIAHLYSAYHPAVLRLIHTTIENGRKAGKWVGICGESAGDPHLQPLFVAMGVNELSMSSSKILPSRKQLTQMNKGAWKGVVNRVLNMDTAEEVRCFVKAL